MRPAWPTRSPHRLHYGPSAFRRLTTASTAGHGQWPTSTRFRPETNEQRTDKQKGVGTKAPAFAAGGGGSCVKIKISVCVTF